MILEAPQLSRVRERSREHRIKGSTEQEVVRKHRLTDQSVLSDLGRRVPSGKRCYRLTIFRTMGFSGSLRRVTDVVSRNMDLCR